MLKTLYNLVWYINDNDDFCCAYCLFVALVASFAPLLHSGIKLMLLGLLINNMPFKSHVIVLLGRDNILCVTDVE